MYYFDNDSKKFLSVKEIRRLDFEENIRDLTNNKEDIFEGIISIESVCEYLQQSLNGKIEDVIEDLNLCWGYDITGGDKIENKIMETIKDLLEKNNDIKETLACIDLSFNFDIKNIDSKKYKVRIDLMEG